MCASRGTSEMPSPPATSPITACQSPARCATRGLNPAARQPARKTSSHDQPTGGATQSSSAELREVDPGAARRAGGRSAAPRRARRRAAPRGGSARRRGAARPSTPCRGSRRRRGATSSATASGVSASWTRSVEPRARSRAAAARRARAGPRARSGSRRSAPRRAASSSCAARSPSSRSSWANSASAWPSRTCAAGVSRTLRPAGSSSALPDLALERRRAAARPRTA